MSLPSGHTFGLPTLPREAQPSMYAILGWSAEDPVEQQPCSHDVAAEVAPPMAEIVK